MLKLYQETIRAYRNDRISLRKERRLIALAQKGCNRSRQEIVLRHVGFIVLRLRRKVDPQLLARHLEDMVSAGIIILHEKIGTYNLNYRDKNGKRKRVRFISYIWKRIDGFIVDYPREEFKYRQLNRLE